MKVFYLDSCVVGFFQLFQKAHEKHHDGSMACLFTDGTDELAESSGVDAEVELIYFIVTVIICSISFL